MHSIETLTLYSNYASRFLNQNINIYVYIFAQNSPSTQVALFWQSTSYSPSGDSAHANNECQATVHLNLLRTIHTHTYIYINIYTYLYMCSLYNIPTDKRFWEQLFPQCSHLPIGYQRHDKNPSISVSRLCCSVSIERYSTSVCLWDHHQLPSY